MWSFIDFLIAETRKEGVVEQFLFYVAAAAFVFFVFFLRFMVG